MSFKWSTHYAILKSLLSFHLHSRLKFLINSFFPKIRRILTWSLQNIYPCQPFQFYIWSKLITFMHYHSQSVEFHWYCVLHNFFKFNMHDSASVQRQSYIQLHKTKIENDEIKKKKTTNKKFFQNFRANELGKSVGWLLLVCRLLNVHFLTT